MKRRNAISSLSAKKVLKGKEEKKLDFAIDLIIAGFLFYIIRIIVVGLKNIFQKDGFKETNYKECKMKIFGARLKELRKRNNLTQKELAEQIGIKQNSYSDWENGKTEPSFENLIKLADLFEVSLDCLLGREQMKVKKRSPAQSLDNAKYREKMRYKK